MKRGFTLLELIVVIIILGILATLGLTQYGRTIERSRGSEARAILGQIRKFAAAGYLENGTISGLTALQAGIGPGADQIPDTCRVSHYFSYAVAGADPSVTITATRCGAGGKNPQGGPATGTTLILTSNLNTGVDSWTGTGGY